MKVNITNYWERLWTEDLFTAIILEENFDLDENGAPRADCTNWEQDFRAELNSYISAGCCAERAADYSKAIAILDEMEQAAAEQINAAAPDYTALAYTIRAELNARHDRSAWDKAVTRCTLSTCWRMCRRARTIWSACPLTVQSLSGGRSTVQAAGSSTATAAVPSAMMPILPPASAPRPNSSASTVGRMSPTAGKSGLTCKPARCIRLATVSAKSAAPTAYIIRRCNGMMITLDFSQWAALWYVGGMISGALVIIAFLNS